jgi:hypothetical protein
MAVTQLQPHTSMPLTGNATYEVQNSPLTLGGVISYGAYTTILSDPQLNTPYGIAPGAKASLNVNMPNPKATLTLINTGNTVLTVTGPGS